MTDLVVRRLLVDMQAPIERHWCDGCAFRTAFMNALSMSFPIGEQFFIDAVRGGFKDLPPDRQADLAAEVQAFVGQEATHRRLHQLYNAHLERQGLDNAFEVRARHRLRHVQGIDWRHWLAISAASEHFTAIFADWVLRNPDTLGDRDERLQTLWLWHSAEETEHKSTVFDIYLALGGNHRWRMYWFRRVSAMFVIDALRQTVNNLYRDRSLFQWRTWRNGMSFLFGRRGLLRQTVGPWRDYLRPDFHPGQHDSSASERWLTENGHRFKPVRS